jgi:Transcriptional Coactivator p15 (PC4)
MPKKRSSEYQSDDGFVVDGDNHKSSKKAKTGDATLGSSSNQKTDSNGDPYWDISNSRRVTVSTFRGKSMVNIREYYEKDGQELPGKKVCFFHSSHI